MKGAAADALVAALGADRVSQGEGDAFTVAPRDGEELAVALGCLAEHETPVAVRGHGTRPDFGNPLRDVGGALSTVALSGVLEFDEQDGVLHVGAGAQLAGVAETVARAGWELPLDPPGAGTSVGGAIATSATGPRRLRYGEPRRAILGLSVALASGERRT